MSRYIDCEKCIHYQICCGYTSKEAIAESNRAMNNGESLLCFMYAPTADVVEVCRCKDCKHLEIINSREIYAKCKATGLEFKPFDIDTREHYCSYGERREENER